MSLIACGNIRPKIYFLTSPNILSRSPKNTQVLKLIGAIESDISINISLSVKDINYSCWCDHNISLDFNFYIGVNQSF